MYDEMKENRQYEGQLNEKERNQNKETKSGEQIEDRIGKKLNKSKQGSNWNTHLR